MMEVGNALVNKKQTGHWSQGLLASITDLNLVVTEDDMTDVTKDKYPKAQYHFLVIPKDSIASTSKLNRSHIQLLKHIMQQKGELRISCKIRLLADISLWLSHFSRHQSRFQLAMSQDEEALELFYHRIFY